MRNVLSLFDGIGCLYEALNRARVQFDNYYACEINLNAILIALKNHPNIIHLGNVCDLDPKNLKDIFLVTAGFPCQSFSIQGKRRGAITATGINVTSLQQYLELKDEGVEFEGEGYLFWEMIRIIKGLPKGVYFFIENVTKIDHQFMEIINNELGIPPHVINASSQTMQNRNRNYWTNLPFVKYPEDKGLTLDMFIPGAVSTGTHGVDSTLKSNKHLPNPKNVKWVQKTITRTDGKVNCLTSGGGTRKCIVNGVTRPLTVEECEIIQTLPKGYTSHPKVSKTQQYIAIGNAWSVDAVVPFFIPLTI